MQLPNGEVLMHASAPYDPKKAHEYYLRTRKLKGRKPGQAQPPTAKKSAKTPQQVAKEKAAWENFLKGLPMVKDGADLKTANNFVQSLRGKSDDVLKKISADLKAQNAKAKGPSPLGAQADTIDALLKNRGRARKSTATGAQQKIQKQAAVKKVGTLKKKLADLNDKLKAAMAKADKKPTAAEKSKDAREAKKYRQSHKTELKTKAKQAAAKESGSSSKTSSDNNSVEGLKKQIDAAKKELADAEAKVKALA
jgi:chromosome segregation ATPase